MKIKIDSPSKAKIGDFIKKLRKKFFLTQEEVSKKIGVSRPTYIKIESDLADITLEQAKKLADFFNVSLVDLMSAQDNANFNIRAALLGPVKEKEFKIDSPLSQEKLSECLLLIWSRLAGVIEFNETYIHKIIFLMEYRYLLKFEQPLFALSYIKKGLSPIIVKYEISMSNLINNSRIEQIISNQFKFPYIKYLPLRDHNLKNFSAQELIIVEQIISTVISEGVAYMDKLINEVEPLNLASDEGVIEIYPQ